MARTQRILTALACIVAIGVGLFFWRPWIPRVEVGGVRINPYAPVSETKQYKVVVWDYEVPLPWSQITHSTALAEAVKEFQQQHPNITVELVVRNWDEGDGPFRDTLEAGNPPDVLGMPESIRLLDKDYQIPLERYLNADDTADLFASAQHAATAEHHMWAFPRWVCPARWVIRLDRWPGGRTLAEAGKELVSLTASQWEEAMAEARTKAGRSGLAVNVYDPAFFRDLMVSATGQSFLSEDGRIQWSEESIRNVAALLGTWMKRGLIPKDVETLSRNRLAQFWSGSAVALAPANPWLLHHILQRSGTLASPEGDPASPTVTGAKSAKLESIQRTAVWMTPPLLKQSPAVAATVSGYAVFRQAQYQGHDHTQAAVTVARYLSERMGAWEASRLFAVPARPSAVAEWLAASRLPEQDLRALLTWSAWAVVPPVDDRLARLESSILTETAIPNLVQVLKGKMTPEQFAQELVSSPVSASAEVAVQ